MKILIFSTAYFPRISGAEIAIQEITKRLPQHQWEVITLRLFKEDAKKEIIDGIKVHRIGWGINKIDKLLFPFRAAYLANKLHRQHPYDATWSMMASYSGFAALFFKKKHPKVKFLLTLQEGDDLKEVERKARFVKKWFKQIFTRADYVQCISNYLAEWAKKMGARCAVEVVPNGVGWNAECRMGNAECRMQNGECRMQNAECRMGNAECGIQNSECRMGNAECGMQNSECGMQNSEIIKKELGINNNDKVILTTSRLVKKNGIEDLIRAVEVLVKRKMLNVKLIICGVGELEGKLKKLAKDLKIEDKVEFRGFVLPEELVKYYAIADVFCRPSLSEGLGNSFLEAMAVGVPVVATPVGGIPDFLQDPLNSSGQMATGWFCETKNPESIAEKIKWILDEKNKEEVAPVVENAKKLVEEKYNWDTVAKQMENIFQKLGA